MDEERRVLTAKFELRKAADKPATLAGYAAKFNVRSEDLGGWVEEIKPGAFDKVLQAKPDTRALLNHDPNLVLGRTSSGTVRLSTDDVGLLAEIDLPDTQAARDLAVSIGRGDIDQMSFGFRVAAGGALWDLDSDPAVRSVSEVAELLDVSVVTYPAYPQTEVGLRSLQEARAAVLKPEPAPIERLRREIASRDRGYEIQS
jgi:HK97 family phage prohead protease